MRGNTLPQDPGIPERKKLPTSGMGTEEARQSTQFGSNALLRGIRSNRNGLREGVFSSEPSGDLRTIITVTAGASPVPSCFLSGYVRAPKGLKGIKEKG